MTTIKGSRKTKSFRDAFQELPPQVQRGANAAFRLWQTNPSHPSLRFKRVHESKPIFSVRIGLNWRALGVLEADQMIWFWIGSHADYDKLLRQF